MRSTTFLRFRLGLHFIRECNVEHDHHFNECWLWRIISKIILWTMCRCLHLLLGRPHHIILCGYSDKRPRIHTKRAEIFWSFAKTWWEIIVKKEGCQRISNCIPSQKRTLTTKYTPKRCHGKDARFSIWNDSISTSSINNPNGQEKW